VPVVLVAQVAQVALRVPVAQHVQVVSQVAHVRPVQALPVQVAALLVVPQAALQAALVVQVAAQAQVVAVALAVEPQVLSVRAVLAVRARLASQSARNAKSLNSAAMRHHLVARWFHAETATPSFACVADLQSKTSPTRLTPMQVS
jgi:hypothetical protein